jgi:TorA maturation chaperone TorD
MQTNQNVVIYAFLSRVFSDVLDKNFINDLKKNSDMLSLLGSDTLTWFEESSVETIHEELSIEFSSLLLQNTQPVESFILDAKQEALVGLQNPVMQFYFSHNYEIDMNQTHILAPDHLAIELGFMQALSLRNELRAQQEFLQAHLLNWVVPYLIGMKESTTTPFYRDLFDFTVEYLIAQYHLLSEGN